VRRPVVLITGAGGEIGHAHVARVTAAGRPVDTLALQPLDASIARHVVRERPAGVFSTGAAPGCFAILVGRLLGARTIWLDSIALSERLSLSGRLWRRVAGLCLTQWPQVSERGVEYAGDVL